MSTTPDPTPTAQAAGSESCAWTELRAHWERCAKLDKDYRTPDEGVLLLEMFTRYNELKKHGWQDIIYCPKDGTEFLSISAGSTGVHRCHYDGEWPCGFWWIHEAGDLWPAHPILWKPMPPNQDLLRGDGDPGAAPETKQEGKCDVGDSQIADAASLTVPEAGAATQQSPNAERSGSES